MKTPDIIRSKIFTLENLVKRVAIWRMQSKKIVFTNGCFDLLHLGHMDYLSKAADKGDVLIVAVNTDASVKRNKGANRPVNNEIQRASVLASLLFVDAVILFDEETPLHLITEILPDVLVKGSDYEKEKIVGYDVITKHGGEVFTIDFLQGYSSSSIIERIRNS